MKDQTKKTKQIEDVMLLSFCDVPTIKLLENTLPKEKLPDVWRKLCLSISGFKIASF